MTSDMLFIFGLLGVTITLFIIDRIRMDIVALMVVVALALSGIITPAETVSGFGQSVVVMIAGLFIIGEGLFRTGVAAALGNWLLRVGQGSEVRLLSFLIPVVAGLSAFMSSTGAVALFIPVVLSMARKSGMHPSRLLMPLAFASLIGGMLTLIGTPPNIVVSAQMQSAGHAPFGFFDFTLIGAAILLVGSLYLIFVARHLLPRGELRDPDNPHPHLKEFAERYGISERLHKMQLTASSALVGKTVTEAELRTCYEVTVFGIQRHGRLVSTLMPVLSETRMKAGDILMAYGTLEDLERLCVEQRINLLGFPEHEINDLQQEFGVAEVLLRRSSSLLDKTIKQGRFRERFNLSVIGVRRGNDALLTDFNNTRLAFGDTLLLTGGWSYIEALESKRDFVVIETPAELTEIPSRREQAPVALAIMAAMLVAMVSGLLPSLTAILLAALAMILSRCVTMEEGYRSLNGPSLILIAGMLPLALAMEKSGALELVVDQLLGGIGDYGPIALCAGLFVFTSVFSQFISNTATTVLVAPIALAAAQGLGLNPEPFMMTVALAASTAFATPIASPVNTLVLAPGNYRFIDFVKVGMPLQILAMIITLTLTPMLFPFSG